MVVFLACVILLVIYLIYFLVAEYFESKDLPPGPFPLPIIGNLHLFSSMPHLDLYRISKTYGPVCRVRMGCNSVIVINNYKYAKEAMLKRGTDFAGRPSQYVGREFSRQGKGVGFQTYTDMLKLQRKIVIKTLNELERKSVMEDIVSTETRGLICRMGSGKTGNVLDGLHHDSAFAMSNTVASVSFGEPFHEGDSEFFKLMDAVAVFQESLAATGFIDTFPFLKYFPFDIIKKVKKACAVRDTILEKKYKELKEAYDSKEAVHSTRNLMEALIEAAHAESFQGHQKISEDHILMTVNDAFIAGSETPVSNLLWVTYYLVKCPDVQKRIQKELDEVIGSDRPPKWNERQNLPYLQAFLAEIHRVCSIMPFGIPHQAIRDSFLGPYKIPKGRTVMLNVWAIHRDPEVWENSMEFKPERFLDDHGQFSVERGKRILAFGLGHRTCPGETLAKMEAFLQTAQLLQKFDFKQAEGEILPAESDGSFGIVLRPASFNVCITPRN